MRETLEQLLHTEKPWCQERAALALSILDQYDEGAISDIEMMSLMEDLVRSDRLDSEADDLELKTHLIMAVYAAGKLI
jgi:hypothetical protein